MRNILFALFLLVGLFAVDSEAQGRNSFVVQTQGTASVTTSSTSIIAADIKRNYMIIQNLGTSNIYVKFGSAHTGDEGVVVAPNGFYEPYMVPRGAVFMKSAAGTQTVNYMTGR